MKIQKYTDMSVKGIDHTPISKEIFKFACDITMKKSDDISPAKASPELLKSLIKAGHTSVLEHSSITLLCKGISRSLLAQVTRQRHFSFTSASQHYQDYRDYPMSIRPGPMNYLYNKALEQALESYLRLLNSGESKEDARQVLPNACCVNLLITANPRALLEFLQVRLCRRNTWEMLIFADKVKKVCLNWIPEIFTFALPACELTGQCDQGRLSCKKS